MRRPRPPTRRDGGRAQPAGFTDQIVKDDSQFGKLLHTEPGFAQEVSRLLDQVKPNLPVFLANLFGIGQIGVTYHPVLEPLRVLPPPPSRHMAPTMSLTTRPSWGRQVHADHRRPAGVHGEVPAAVAVAIPPTCAMPTLRTICFASCRIPATRIC